MVPFQGQRRRPPRAAWQRRPHSASVPLMKGWTFCWALVAAALLLSRGAQARPQHRGFTGDLSLGISMVRTPYGAVDGPRQTRFGVAGLSASLGGYVVPQVALVARLAGT